MSRYSVGAVTVGAAPLSRRLKHLRSAINVGLAILPALVALAFTSCSKREPVDGFWNYKWGTTYDQVRADSADIRQRLAGERFRIARDTMQVSYFDVQYGLGYDDIALDFTQDGKLWHGRVITSTIGGADDSVLSGLKRSYGSEVSPRRFEQPGGFVTYWQTRDWFYRDYFSAALTPVINAQDVKRIDLMHGGCPTECAVYSIRLLTSGDAYLWGIRGIPELGGFKGSIEPSAFQELAAYSATPEFLAFADSYEYENGELPSLGVRVDYGWLARAKESVAGSGPPELENYLAKLDSVAAQIAWTQTVSWDTIRLFDQFRVNLDSLEALGSTQ